MITLTDMRLLSFLFIWVTALHSRRVRGRVRCSDRLPEGTRPHEVRRDICPAWVHFAFQDSGDLMSRAVMAVQIRAPTVPRPVQDVSQGQGAGGEDFPGAPTQLPQHRCQDGGPRSGVEGLILETVIASNLVYSALMLVFSI